jgi:hypothetical protein
LKHWQSGEMVVRWMAVSLDASSKAFRRVMGYKSLWILKTNLHANQEEQTLEKDVKVG